MDGGGEISATLSGLSAKMEHNIKDTRQIHGNQTRTGGENGRKREHRRGIKNSIESSPRQSEAAIGKCLYDEATARRVQAYG